jgi:beta-barrel assembly-enhancing protease
MLIVQSQGSLCKPGLASISYDHDPPIWPPAISHLYMLPYSRLAFFIVLMAGSLAPCLSARADDLNLPELGNSISGVVSPQQERELGQVFLRLYRSRVPEYDDPLLTAYLENVLAKVARSSELNDKHLDLIVISNPQINAFAAPGGVVGVHSGLFLYAQSEGELAGVLAHELAHLSQRHFARGVEKSQSASLPTIAGMLAGLILMAGGAGDAGMAAIASTQAAGMQSSLRFSRQNEQEADDIGIQTLVAAGYDPTAMTSMFEHMLDATRFMGQRVPEFLLSHPVTEQRIAESRARLNNLKLQAHYPDNPEYHLMRARVQLYYAESPQLAIKRFQSEIDGNTDNVDASRYGLALAQTKAHQYDEAEKNFRALLQMYPGQNTIMLGLATLNFEREQYSTALTQVDVILKNDPKHYPARMLQAKALRYSKKYLDAESVLQRLSIDRPDDAEVWYDLAEAHGQAGNIPGVHLARAEFFILNGIYDKARQQLAYAQKLLANNYVATEKIKQRLLDIDKLEQMSLNI